MIQTEIKFFWPLTEQLELDLDYTDCEKPKITTPINTVTYTLYDSNTTGTTTLTASNMTIDIGTTTFKVDKEPPLYRKFLYRLMNINWEKK